jgi:hypothetical protein
MNLRCLAGKLRAVSWRGCAVCRELRTDVKLNVQTLWQLKKKEVKFPIVSIWLNRCGICRSDACSFAYVVQNASRDWSAAQL